VGGRATVRRKIKKNKGLVFRERGGKPGRKEGEGKHSDVRPAKIYHKRKH